MTTKKERLKLSTQPDREIVVVFVADKVLCNNIRILVKQKLFPFFFLIKVGPKKDGDLLHLTIEPATAQMLAEGQIRERER